MYRTSEEILQEMLVELKNITGIELKSTDLHREEVVRLAPVAASLSAVTSQLKQVYDDFFPNTSSEEGLELHIDAKQLPERSPTSNSNGIIKLTGVDTTFIDVGTRVKRKLTGQLFESTGSGQIGESISDELDLNFKSLLKNQDNNISSIGEDFELITVIEDVDKNCTNVSEFRDGRNLETPADMLDRIEDNDKNVNTGGNLIAYEEWAKEASQDVVTARPIKHYSGVGTVSTVITSGTTDIEKAVSDGIAVQRIPSQELLDIVQAYILEKNPLTDIHTTIAPSESSFNTTVTYTLYDETQRGYVNSEITKIWKVFVYQAKSGERLFPTTLERLIDKKLVHLVKSRTVEDFSGVYYKEISNDEILVPGSITLDEQ